MLMFMFGMGRPYQAPMRCRDGRRTEDALGVPIRLVLVLVWAWHQDRSRMHNVVALW